MKKGSAALFRNYPKRSMCTTSGPCDSYCGCCRQQRVIQSDKRAAERDKPAVEAESGRLCGLMSCRLSGFHVSYAGAHAFFVSVIHDKRQDNRTHFLALARPNSFPSCIAGFPRGSPCLAFFFLLFSRCYDAVTTNHRPRRDWRCPQASTTRDSAAPPLPSPFTLSSLVLKLCGR